MPPLTIVHNNLVDASGVTVTSSTEASGFDKENAQSVQPSQRFRTTVTNPGYVDFAFSDVAYWQLAAMVGCVVTPQRNIILNSNDWTAAQYSNTNLGGAWAPNTTPLTLPPGRLAQLTTDGSAASVDHYVEYQSTIESYQGGLLLSAYVWYKTGTPVNIKNYRLYLDGTGLTAGYADFDANAGTILAESNVSEARIENLGADPVVGGTWYRISVTSQIGDNSNSPITVTARLYSLDTSGNTPYSGGLDNLNAGGLQLEIVDDATATPAAYSHTGSAEGAVWDVTASGASPLYRMFALEGGLGGRDTIDTYRRLSAKTVEDTSLRFNVYDPNNANSRIDIGRAIVGPVLEPTTNFIQVETDDSGRFRRWHLRSERFVTDNERWGEFAELRRNNRIVSPSDLKRGPNGHLSARDAKPILVILDPSVAANAQERMIYAWVVGLRASRIRRWHNTIDMELWECKS